MAPEVVTFMLPKLLPRQKANEILMTGRRISADELHRAGIINEVVPKEQLMDKARELASDVLKASPLSLAARKEAILRKRKSCLLQSFMRHYVQEHGHSSCGCWKVTTPAKVPKHF